MAYERDDCRELSRMIRDDLIRLGVVDPGQSVEISEGQRASAGDVIVCRENDSRLETDPGHRLANGDVFWVESTANNGAWVRRVLGTDRGTGEMRLAGCAFFYGDSKLRVPPQDGRGRDDEPQRSDALDAAAPGILPRSHTFSAPTGRWPGIAAEIRHLAEMPPALAARGLIPA
jgi:hypothetical protein